jgi:formylmethanofuran dehydrogenase subunit B
MSDAWIDGKAVARPDAIAQAARVLGVSRFPLIAGLGTDIAGARAAIALAARLGGAIDHMHSDVVLRDVDVMREAGLLMTTPNEARLRADVVLLIGQDLTATWPELPRLLETMAAADGREREGRRIRWLCPGHDEPKSAAANTNIQSIGLNPRELPIVLAALRARIAGRPVRDPPIQVEMLDRLIGELRAATFGVAVWSASELDTLAIEMLCGLINDLNAAARFTGLPLVPGDNAWGVLQACGWTTGFPMRTGFGRGFPEHDPWRFDGTRLIDSGEADCALWISAYRATAPLWQRDVTMIALTSWPANFRHPPHVHIAVGCPGRDHDGVDHLATTGTLAPAAATNRADAISVASTIAAITAALPDHGTVSC